MAEILHQSHQNSGFLDKAKGKVDEMAQKIKDKFSHNKHTVVNHANVGVVNDAALGGSNIALSKSDYLVANNLTGQHHVCDLDYQGAGLSSNMHSHSHSHTHSNTHSQAYSQVSSSTQSSLSFLNSEHVNRQVIHEDPVVTTKVIQENATLVEEIIHEIPIIEKEIHERDVIYKDIIHERPIVEKEIHEVPIFTTETIRHDIEYRGNLPQERQLHRQVIQESARVSEQHIQDQAYIAQITEHDKPLIHKEIHMVPVIEKEIIHERPIIEREVREVPMYQKEVLRDSTYISDLRGAERKLETKYVQEAAVRDTEVIEENPILRAEYIHEKPIIEKQIYEKPVITKEIVHEKPMIERHLIENRVGQTQVIRESTQVEEVRLVDEAIYQSYTNDQLWKQKAHKLVWLDSHRFMIEDEGIFHRWNESYHGPLEKYNTDHLYVKDQGLLRKFVGKLQDLAGTPRDNVFVRTSS